MALQFPFQPEIKFLVYSLCRFWLGGIFKVIILSFNFSALKLWLLKQLKLVFCLSVGSYRSYKVYWLLFSRASTAIFSSVFDKSQTVYSSCFGVVQIGNDLSQFVGPVVLSHLLRVSFASTQPLLILSSLFLPYAST